MDNWVGSRKRKDILTGRKGTEKLNQEGRAGRRIRRGEQEGGAGRR
jgi:hypothetical protein